MTFLTSSITSRVSLLPVIAAVAVVAMACNIDPFLLSGDRSSDGGVVDDGGNGGGDGGNGGGDGGNGGGDGGNGQPDACIPEPESCDGIDNDCDGNTDEDFDLTQDPANCGSCGNACNLPGAAGVCSSSTCQYTCVSLFHDLNGDLNSPGSNGCEYGPCDGTAADPEVCNLDDDDCDGQTDENITGLDSDPLNCGSCFNQCIAVNVETTTCVGGNCGYTACLDEEPDGVPDFADLDPGTLGCEYKCPVRPRLAQEVCNALDDDCDGQIDELPITGLGGSCGPNPPGEVGECEFGTLECNFGVPTCVGGQGPQPEVCDGLDNDCDGQEDDGFDTDNDPQNCGPSCITCDLPNAIADCASGVCVILTCRPGFENPDGQDANGCEYACTNTGNEVCDGRDNDCDTQTDEDVVRPNICNQNGACSGTLAQCTKDPCDSNSATQWRCLYGGSAETDGCGNLLFEETLCDLIDGDCDTGTDEAFPVGDPCDDGGTGICRGTGNIICDPGDTSATSCDITNAGKPPLADERCNSLDDDCDGTSDEASTDDMIAVDPDSDGVTDYYIDTYEASRPDASAAAAGIVTTHACSNPDVLPWRTITWPDAEAACQAVGKRLCTEAEWKLACGGLASNLYPYGNTYEPLSCNGFDYDVDNSTASDAAECSAVVNDEEGVLPTGHDYDCPAVADSCISAFGVHDLSGNLEEWTGEVVGANSRRVLGGSYTTIEGGLTCEYDFLAFDDTVAFPTLGFRCCRDGP